MANLCAFCGRALGVFASTFDVIDGSDAKLCAACFTQQMTLKRALDEWDQSKIVQLTNDIKRNSLTPAEAGMHIDAIVQKFSERAKSAWQAERLQQQKKEDLARERAEKEKYNAIIREKKTQLMTTVGFSFEGYKIVEYIDIISGGVVLEEGFLSVLNESHEDNCGSKQREISSKLLLAKEAAFEEAKENCIAKGGNAIVGVSFDYITLPNNMICVVANGTTVQIAKSEV